MQHDLLGTLDKLFDYIEDHIQDKLTLDHLASVTHISKFHLHRMFKHVSGQLPGEYIRSRKLARSLEQLVNLNWKIIDISGHYGFEHEQSYIRAFKQTFGITPLQYRKQGAGDLEFTARMTSSMITMYEKSDPYYFERIDGSLAQDHYGEMDIYIPAKQISL